MGIWTDGDDVVFGLRVVFELGVVFVLESAADRRNGVVGFADCIVDSVVAFEVVVVDKLNRVADLLALGIVGAGEHHLQRP